MKVIEITTFLGLPLATVLTGCKTAAKTTTDVDVAKQAGGDAASVGTVDPDTKSDPEDGVKAMDGHHTETQHIQDHPEVGKSDVHVFHVSDTEMDAMQYEHAKKNTSFTQKRYWTVFDLAKHYNTYKKVPAVTYDDPDGQLKAAAEVVASALADTTYLEQAETKTFWLKIWYDFQDKAAKWRTEDQNEANTVHESLLSNDDVWLEFFRKCYNEHFGPVPDLTADTSDGERGTFTAAKLSDGLTLDLTQPDFNKKMADIWHRWSNKQDGKFTNTTDIEFKTKDGSAIKLEAKSKVSKRMMDTKKQLVAEQAKRQRQNGGSLAL